MNESVRLLELLIGLSRATDLGMGLKVGEPVRSAALGAGLARAFELDNEGTREALYATLLTEALCGGLPSGRGGRLSIRRSRGDHARSATEGKASARGCQSAVVDDTQPTALAPNSCPLFDSKQEPGANHARPTI